MITREQWLQDAADLMLDELIRPAIRVRSDLKIKIAMSWLPFSNPLSKKVGACLSQSCSTGAFSEIYINPILSDSQEVLLVLLHEVIHAIDNNKNSHKGDFKIVAKSVGFVSPFTAINASLSLVNRIKEYISILGNISHSAVDLSNIKRQTTRSHKVWCTKCKFVFSTSRKQIFYAEDSCGGTIGCAACGGNMKHEQNR